MQIPKWEEYITVPVGGGRFGASRRRYYQAFLSQRQELQNVLAHYKPKRVACLGAGYQNDIPLEDFLREGCEVFLVDWIPRICAEGFSQSLVSDQEGVRTCLVCAGMLDPNRYCRAYREPIDPIHQVCAGY